MNNDTSYPSPDGRYIVHITPIPMRMSHEVDCPAVYETEGQKLIFDPGEMWEAGNVEWSADSRYLRMEMQHYDDGASDYDLKLDLEKRSGILTSDNEIVYEGSFEDLQDWMECFEDPSEEY